MKKLSAVLALAALSLVVVSPAAAFTTSISNIFDSSSGKSIAKWKLDVKMLTNNSAVVATTVTSESESGENKIKSWDDMENTSIETYDTDAASLSDTTVNTNALEEDLNGAEDGDTTITTIEDDSEAFALVEDENEEEVEFNNSVVAADSVEAEADTGDNEIFSGGSVLDAHIVAGKALTASGAVKILNSNIKSIVRH